jgi:hypothetical protein
MEDLKCGLIYILNERRVPVPLKKVQLHVKVVDFISEVNIIQDYVNHEADPIEVLYSFPIEESAAIIGFEASINDHVIVAQVKEKEKAKAEYQQAMRDRNSAILLDETAPDIFKMNLGQLKAGEKAQVKLTYIMELPIEEKSVRLTIPTTIAPRYIPPNDDSLAAKEISKIGYKDDSSPKTPLHVNIAAFMKGKILEVTSPTHDIDVKINQEPNEHGQFKAMASLKDANTDVMDRDLIVILKSEKNDEPSIFLEKNEKTLAAMVSLIPSFQLDQQKTELIFLVDRSGSMGGSSMELAKEALKLFLHSMPVDCYFNIWSFGSDFSSLFKKGSKLYNDDTLAEAKNHVNGMNANFGGTEVYNPLQNIFTNQEIDGYARQIFLLTDGDVSNSDRVIQLVKENANKTRVFTLGLGSSASRHLVKGVARAGNGLALFSNLNEDLRPKVINLLKNALMPSLTNVKVLWNQDDESENSKPAMKEKVRTLLGFNKPKKEENLTRDDGGKVLFDGSRLLSFKIFEKDQTLEKVTIVAQAPDGPLKVTLPISDNDYLEAGNFVHQMAARQLIQDLETNSKSYEILDKVKKEVTDLGLEYGLATRYTSFVGVDKQTKKMLHESAMITRHIDHEIPRGFGSAYMANSQIDYLVAPAAMCQMFAYSLQEESEEEEQCDMFLSDMCYFSAPEQKSRKAEKKMQSFVPESSDDSDSEKEMECSVKEPGLNEMIDLQSANGTFKMGKSIETLLDMKEEDIKKKCPQGVELDVWITALCIILIETKFKESKDLWELVTSKARKSIECITENLDEILVEAKKHV